VIYPGWAPQPGLYEIRAEFATSATCSRSYTIQLRIEND
jgi:hypothetical protein